MQNSQIRNQVKDLYPHSSSWHRRVDRMFDQQVYAIWKDHQEKEEQEEQANPKQLSLF
jgi:hypothetical protein